jgi:hypothetical protein
LKLQAHDARLDALANPPADPAPAAAVWEFVYKTLVIAGVELRKLRHDPTDLLTRAVQPALWLLLFGQVLGRVRAIPTGGLPYLDYLAPGILAQSVLFIAIFYGIAIIWERDLGIVHKLLASPTPRAALVLGKALSGGVRGVAQAVIVYGRALLLGVKLRWDAAALIASSTACVARPPKAVIAASKILAGSGCSPREAAYEVQLHGQVAEQPVPVGVRRFSGTSSPTPWRGT